MVHLKLPDKQEQGKPKIGRIWEIIKIKAEINEIETKKIQRIKKTKSWFFENNKQDPRLTWKIWLKWWWKRPKLGKSEVEKGEITTNTKEIQGIIRDYFDNL
jgi:hypothetical protein